MPFNSELPPHSTDKLDLVGIPRTEYPVFTMDWENMKVMKGYPVWCPPYCTSVIAHCVSRWFPTVADAQRFIDENRSTIVVSHLLNFFHGYGLRYALKPEPVIDFSI